MLYYCTPPPCPFPPSLRHCRNGSQYQPWHCPKTQTYTSSNHVDDKNWVICIQPSCSSQGNTNLENGQSREENGRKLELGLAPYLPMVNKAMTRMVEVGVVVVVLVDRSNVDACQTSLGATPGVITIVATNTMDARATFSNFGF